MLTVRKATAADLPVMEEIFACAREYMKNEGNPTQWGTDRPPKNAVLRDISRGVSYLVLREEIPVGTFSFFIGAEPTYEEIDGKWLSDAPYGTIHRIASNGKAAGIFDAALKFCMRSGVDIRIDTHEKNRTMLRHIEESGFIYCGEIVVDDGTKRKAFQKIHTGGASHEKE